MRDKAESRTKGLSMARAVRAMCWECNGGTSHVADCAAYACPLYAFRFKDTLWKAKLWWTEPTSKWEKGSQVARGRKDSE